MWRLWIVWWALASSELILSHFPNLKEYMEKLNKSRGIIWVALLIIWIIGLIRFFTSAVSQILWTFSPVWYILNVINYVVSIILWLLLGYDIISKNVPGGKKAEDAVAQANSKLKPYTEKLWLAAIVIGILSIIL